MEFFPSGDDNTAMNRAHWRDWLAQISPRMMKHPFSDHQVGYWDWLWQIQLGIPPNPQAALLFWPRGHAKSTSAEVGAAALGARNRRRYGLYVCQKQQKADEHVANIGGILESGEMHHHYPAMGERLVNQYGQSKGWRRNRLRASTGFTIDALGLDTAARGTKLDEQRPDFIIIDDIDETEDSPRIVQKKERLLTRGILPAGSNDVVVIFAQNLIHSGSLAYRLSTGQAEWLADRYASGPYAAVENLKYESTGIEEDGRILWKITGGRPTWEGMDIAECERRMNLSGPDAFIAESQNDVTSRKGALWQMDVINESRVPSGYERGHGQGVVRTVVAVDPSVSDSPNSDECGIVVVAKGADGRGYVLEDLSVRAHPSEWARRVVYAARRYGAQIVAETNNGGLLVKQNIRMVDPYSGVHTVHAKTNKQLRAQPIATLYQEGFVHHVGRFQDLEQQMTSWVPGESDSPDRLDALVYAVGALFPATGVVSQKRYGDGRGRK